MKFSIAVLPGDGVGPEIVAEGVKVLKAVGSKFGHEFLFTDGMIGASSYEKIGEALPKATVDLCRASDAILFGAVGEPRYEVPGLKERPERGYGIIRLRKEMGLFANLRPVKLFPSVIGTSHLKPEFVKGVDFIIVRELTGGIYFGEPKELIRSPEGRSAVDSMRYSEDEIRRIVRVGFELARVRRKKLTSVDKFQILKCSDLWREVAIEVSAEYPDVEIEHALVDYCAMSFIQRPADFDVIVTENLFGDILSDEASMLAGSLGMMPSASLAGIPSAGSRLVGLYEPIHGSAPRRTGLNMINPIATILSGAMMLRYSFGLTKEAQAIEDAVDQVLKEGYRTYDIMSDGMTKLGTKEMGDVIAQKFAG
ncbi:MAG TPA: 3-isopropylmalate dehydrogenase [Syntrophorhabdaceae bacterium]|nr:3-isopropylmalate dehydrogenase [Syntrophorhabdaceae bacterium]